MPVITSTALSSGASLASKLLDQVITAPSPCGLTCMVDW